MCVMQWRSSKDSHICGPGVGACYISEFCNRSEVEHKQMQRFLGYLICTSNVQYSSVRVCNYHFQASCKL